MSHTFAEASQAPETKMFWLGPSDRLVEGKKDESRHGELALY